jgi:hypothetical protein
MPHRSAGEPVARQAARGRLDQLLAARLGQVAGEFGSAGYGGILIIIQT